MLFEHERGRIEHPNDFGPKTLLDQLVQKAERMKDTNGSALLSLLEHVGTRWNMLEHGESEEQMNVGVFNVRYFLATQFV